MQVLLWSERSEALPPSGMVTAGAVTRRLLARLRSVDGQALSRLSVAATRDLLVLIGPADELPWVDGARYCAPDPDVHSLWVPTNMRPVLPPDLIRRSAAARAGDGVLLLWPSPEQFVPLESARSLTPEVLDWLKEQCA
ncbi:hypothetical protein [Massilia sp. CF038]|uniref:bpX5 domain-containing protein n=1 Tax=Massilia sp. CF038 TaxID=1881045 RepID=UPI00090EC482|nr:hypothetical protein [Massilia sp. CF038]SHH13754.1 hypothetical protein SAMN05428948_2971 [Massilia sp. CF038]